MIGSRKRLALTILASAILCPAVRAENLDGSTRAVGDAEAARLYRDANDYVTNVTEGGYSYAYIQFYWRRAESFLERAQRVYPESPTGEGLKAGRLKIGPYELAYFKERVMPRLEEKRVSAYDAVNCAIFLYNRDPMRWDEERYAALDGIVEVLSRQQRWGEAIIFPVLTKDQPRLMRDILTVAARYDQKRAVDQVLARVAPAKRDEFGFWPILGEAQAMLGKPRKDLAKFLDAHPSIDVRRAVLAGMARREAEIRRAAALRLAVKTTITRTHYSILNLSVRDDVESAARQFFPAGDPGASAILADFKASLGEKPSADAPASAQAAYLDYLADFDRLAEWCPEGRLPDDAGPECALAAIEGLARSGHLPWAQLACSQWSARGRAEADQAALALFRGQGESAADPIVVHPETFSSLAIQDPCVLSRAIMEWSLTPNRSIRGAAPWDSVVQRFQPGFDNLPLPKSTATRDAANAVNPY